MKNLVTKFFSEQSSDTHEIENERSLQLELGVMFRLRGYDVRFEVSCAVKSHSEQKRKQKRDIDLFVTDKTTSRHLAIELKVPLAGRVPETMYDFYTDVAFLEAVLRAGEADQGLCILLTYEKGFWLGRKLDGVYSYLRRPHPLHGKIQKPTGNSDETVFVEGKYPLSWSDLGNPNLLSGGRFVVVDVENLS